MSDRCPDECDHDFTVECLSSLRSANAALVRERDEARADAIDIPERVFDDGHWRPCTGCHESNHGSTASPYSRSLRCHRGSGCHECGGLGAVWEQFDEDAMRELETP